MLLPGIAKPKHKQAAERARVAAIDDTALQRLLVGVLNRAVLDAQKRGFTGQEARYWLRLHGLKWFEAMGIGIQPEAFRNWLDAGCPVPDAYATGDDDERFDGWFTAADLLKIRSIPRSEVLKCNHTNQVKS